MKTTMEKHSPLIVFATLHWKKSLPSSSSEPHRQNRPNRPNRLGFTIGAEVVEEPSEIRTVVVEPIPSQEEDVSPNMFKKQKIDDTNTEPEGASARNKSAVWEWFSKFKDGEGRDKAKCKYCSKVYAADPKKNGTSALRTHMITLCRFRQVESKQKMLSFTQKKEDGATIGSLKATKFEEIECKKALAKMIVVDELPFKFVEHEGFRYYANQLEPRFNVPSRTTIAKYCIDLFVEEKQKLKKLLNFERICLTTDTWTSIQKYGYMCLTGHWIDKEWKLHKRILNFVRIVDHSGEGICSEIMKCLSAWDIKKIFTITMDNASVNDVVARSLTRQTKDWKSTILCHEFLQVRCTAHILNLIVKDGLLEYNESIEKIRSAIKYVKSSSQRLEKFKNCVKNAEIESKALLCLDVDTRWNSTYLMLETAIKFERAFDRLVDDFSYQSYFENDPPNGDDWKNARVFVKLLKMFYTVTLEVSGSKYPTSHLFFQNISMMEHMIKTMCCSYDSDISSIAHRMKIKFDKYWGGLEKSNILLYVAFILDPQYKLKRLSKCLFAVTDNIKAREILGMAESTIYRLFDHYNNVDNPSLSQALSCQATTSGICKDDKGDVEYTFATYQKNMFQDDNEDEDSSSTIRKSEILQYIEEDALKIQPNFDILNWWKINSSRFPIVSKIARDILAIPISTVASESAFSTGGRILDQFRSSLLPKTVEALICTSDWLRCKPHINDMDEILVDVEKYKVLDKELEINVSKNE